jgi:hypothetical protein
MNDRERQDFAAHHPHPGDDPWARLGHVLELFPDQPDDEYAITATSNAYSPNERTGLTYGDLRAIANSRFTGGQS